MPKRVSAFVVFCFFAQIALASPVKIRVEKLVKSADLHQKTAEKTHFARDYKKAVDALISAAELSKSLVEQDRYLLRAANILNTELGDKKGAAALLAPFVKQAKARRTQKQLPKTMALYTQLISKTKPALVKEVPRAKVVAETKLVAPEPKVLDLRTLEKITKVDLLDSEKGVGLRLSASGEVEIKHGVIPKSGDVPRRVFFDLSRAELAVSTPLSFAVSKAGVTQVRLGRYKDDVVRVVVEAESPLPFQIKADANSPIEIWFGKAPAEPEKEIKAQAPANPKGLPPSPPLGLALRKIVIDPGHGGYDPGATGKGGLKEKDVTLAIAKRLKASIEAEMPGVKVYLTRDKDKYISLSQRTEFANNMRADLFVSVHVNSSPNPNAQGIETYYLNISHDRYAVRLASIENAMSETEISNLEFILADLAMKSNISDSIHLGRELQSNMYGLMHDSWSDIKDLGLKHALFYVLLGARMPAVLVETAFISNKEDEKRLRTPKYQESLVDGMVKGIKSYSDQKQAMYQASK